MLLLLIIVSEWDRLDSIVKPWLHSTLSTSLLQMIFKKKVITYEVWRNIEKVFQDNKVNKIIQIDNELRNITMGNFTITEYCNRIKNLADFLDNMDAKVLGANLVAYTLNGLPPKFRYIATSISLRHPLSTFWDTQSILTKEKL
ncbi:uncharacterized protein LOC111887043 [Lactuca sativa]|uniref:uncharacterized protein LOC111887043 n=1 Tax=Lactuca sativa TaxID=4236 RepID=UPI000CD907BC|nr:uncharacterized protein LOC111887043 [Lactuca sativa]